MVSFDFSVDEDISIAQSITKEFYIIFTELDYSINNERKKLNQDYLSLQA